MVKGLNIRMDRPYVKTKVDIEATTLMRQFLTY